MSVEAQSRNGEQGWVSMWAVTCTLASVFVVVTKQHGNMTLTKRKNKCPAVSRRTTHHCSVSFSALLAATRKPKTCSHGHAEEQ